MEFLTVPQVEAKIADLSPLSYSASLPKTAQLLKGSYPCMVILRLCPCLPFVAVAITQFKVRVPQSTFPVCSIENGSCYSEKSELYFVLVRQLWKAALLKKTC